MEIKPHRTSSYRFTVDLSNLEDMQVLKQLRESVSHSNKSETKQHRVELKGRLGKNNPKAEKYRVLNQGRGRIYSPYSRIRLEDAAYVDVYINRRYTW